MLCRSEKENKKCKTRSWIIRIVFAFHVFHLLLCFPLNEIFRLCTVQTRDKIEPKPRRKTLLLLLLLLYICKYLRSYLLHFNSNGTCNKWCLYAYLIMWNRTISNWKRTILITICFVYVYLYGERIKHHFDFLDEKKSENW